MTILRTRQSLEETSMAEMTTAHVLLFPLPAQGHVPPMLKLAELLSTTGLYITFVNAESIHRRFLNSSSKFDHLARHPKFRFCVVPDGLPDYAPRSFLKFVDLLESLSSRSREHYRELLVRKEGRDPDGWPPVTCVVADGLLPVAFEVAEEVGIPVMLLRTSSPSSVWVFCSVAEMIKRGEIPFQEEEDMDELMQGVPGMESFLRRRDLPAGLLRKAKSVTDPEIRYLTTVNNAMARVRALILNTVESLDDLALSHISSICPVTYTIGPIQLLLKNIASCSPKQDCDYTGNLNSPTSAGLWPEDRSCMMWLDFQPNKSVVYVSFGSITIVSKDTFLEFWHGLVNSGQRFLWVTRPDMADMTTGLSTGEQGFFVEWAPQEEVLAHPAVGCFLTHSGWNSTLESIIAGVPMICWPFFSDQQVNSRFVSEVWKIGVDMKDLCDRNVVEGMVRKVMDREDAEELRSSASKMSQVSKRAAEVGGSSFTKFQKLVEDIKSLNFQRNLGSN